MEGYKKALEDHGLEYEDSMVAYGVISNEKQAYNAAIKLLGREENRCVLCRK